MSDLEQIALRRKVAELDDRVGALEAQGKLDRVTTRPNEAELLQHLLRLASRIVDLERKVKSL